MGRLPGLMSGQDIAFADAAGDQFFILPAEIQHKDGLVTHRVMTPSKTSVAGCMVTPASV